MSANTFYKYKFVTLNKAKIKFSDKIFVLN